MRRPQRSRGTHEYAIGRVVHHAHSLAHDSLARAGRRPGAVLRMVDADAHSTLARPPTHHRADTVPDTVALPTAVNPNGTGDQMLASQTHFPFLTTFLMGVACLTCFRCEDTSSSPLVNVKVSLKTTRTAASQFAVPELAVEIMEDRESGRRIIVGPTHNTDIDAVHAIGAYTSDGHAVLEVYAQVSENDKKQVDFTMVNTEPITVEWAVSRAAKQWQLDGAAYSDNKRYVLPPGRHIVSVQGPYPVR